MQAPRKGYVEITRRRLLRAETPTGIGRQPHGVWGEWCGVRGSLPQDLLGPWSCGKTSEALMPFARPAVRMDKGAGAVSCTEQGPACCVATVSELSYRCRVPGREPWGSLTPTTKVGLSSSVIHVSQNAQRDGVHGQGHPARTPVEQGPRGLRGRADGVKSPGGPVAQRPGSRVPAGTRSVGPGSADFLERARESTSGFAPGPHCDLMLHVISVWITEEQSPGAMHSSYIHSPPPPQLLK